MAKPRPSASLGIAVVNLHELKIYFLLGLQAAIIKSSFLWFDLFHRKTLLFNTAFKNVLPTRHKKIQQLPPIKPRFFPRQAGADEFQARAAYLILKEMKDRAEVETTLHTGQEMSKSGTVEHTG